MCLALVARDENLEVHRRRERHRVDFEGTTNSLPSSVFATTKGACSESPLDDFGFVAFGFVAVGVGGLEVVGFVEPADQPKVFFYPNCGTQQELPDYDCPGHFCEHTIVFAVRLAKAPDADVAKHQGSIT